MSQPHDDRGTGDRGSEDGGARLCALAPRLRLLLAHLAGRAVRARVEVDDLAQEVFLRVLAHPGGMPEREDGEAALWRLLVHVARHCVIDVARAARAQKRAGRTEALVRSDWSSPGLHESQVAQTGAGLATRAGEAEESGRLARAFERLDPDHRRVIGLRQLEGLSAAETARRMGRTESAVHSLYRRALQAWEAALR